MRPIICPGATANPDSAMTIQDDDLGEIVPLARLSRKISVSPQAAGQELGRFRCENGRLPRHSPDLSG